MRSLDANAEELRDDIAILRVMLDSALDQHADNGTLTAIANILQDRRDQLDELGHGGVRGAA